MKKKPVYCIDCKHCDKYVGCKRVNKKKSIPNENNDCKDYTKDLTYSMKEQKERTYKVTEKITWKAKAKSKDDAIEVCQNSNGIYVNTSWS